MSAGTADPLVRLLASAAPLATSRALGRWLLREDPQYSRIDPARRDDLVDAALEDGRRVADEARARWGDEPVAIAIACGLQVVDCECEAGWGSTVVYADYDAHARRIRLFSPAIAKLERGLARPAVSRIAGAVPARPMLLAHELYHHLDGTRTGPPIARQHPVTLLALGRWHWRSGLASLGEIAAGAFAQRLLRLRRHPRFFDLIAIHDANPAAASRVVAMLRTGAWDASTHEREFAT